MLVLAEDTRGPVVIELLNQDSLCPRNKSILSLSSYPQHSPLFVWRLQRSCCIFDWYLSMSPECFLVAKAECQEMFSNCEVDI